ncbi:MAG: class aldolase/adducin family protein [Acidimicrobiaceae bacterium]|nr:class aldolase/adducin family protein [Acidimicrobiaceae bacterium]
MLLESEITGLGVYEHGQIPELSPHAELALLARALYRTGWDDYDVGHITYRQANDTLLALPEELGFDEVRASDILRMDLEGNKLEGKWSVPPPILLHTEYHKAHPNTEVTIHQHPRYTTIWSACGRVPPPYDQRAAFISTDDIVLYDDYTGGVSAIEASRAAVEAMGSAPMALLRNHGAFVAADSMAQAYGRAIALEWRCKQAWFVEAIGGDSVMPEYGQQALAARNADARVITWNWAVRRELRADPDVLA